MKSKKPPHRPINGALQLVKINEDVEIVKIDPYKTSLQRIDEYYDEDASKEALSATKINRESHSWVKQGNSFFITAKPNVDSIPSGLYDIAASMERGLFLERRGVILDELFYIPDDTIDIILNDFKKFWESKDKYKEYGFTHKRGIFMFGPPGSGKTSLINILIKTIISEYGGIVLNMNDVDHFVAMAHNIRSMEDRPILAIIEDLDGFLDYNSKKTFLNLLDGNLQIDNVVYFSTTNYPERIEPRIINRPSRFDLVVHMDNPKPEAREYYLRKKLLQPDLEKYESQINQWVTDTEGMAYSHLKELIASVVVMNNDYQFTIERLKLMNQNKESIEKT